MDPLPGLFTIPRFLKGILKFLLMPGMTAVLLLSGMTAVLLLYGITSVAQTNSGYPPPGKLRAGSPVYISALERWALVAGKSARKNDTDFITINTLVAKCIFTLLNNRQGPAGGLKHEGIYPSYTGFPGFWAWDSWKHAYALVLGETSLAGTLDDEAIKLGNMIRTMMWDEHSGFFYDIRMDTKKPVLVAEPNGWIPLWAGIATREQARRIRNRILNRDEFNTFVPFPTVAADNPGFDPGKGYWRGPVWLDQAYFAIRGLWKYGYMDDAVRLMNKLFNHCEGLLDPERPVYENYHPLTGKGLNSENFSWSAAHILMIITEIYFRP